MKPPLFWTLVVLMLSMVVPSRFAFAAATLREVRAAVASEPDRPGLRVALAAHLIGEGELDEAEALLNDLIARWPGSTRARALLGAIAQLRSPKESPPQAVETARSVERDSPGPRGPRLTFNLKGSAGVYHDSVAAWDTTPLETQATARDAWRSQLATNIRANYVLGAWHHKGLFGLDRTLHLGSETLITKRDRSLLFLQGQSEKTTPLKHRLGLRADLRGTLGGRPGSVHHFAGGLGGWWSQGAKHLSPFVEARARYFHFAPSATRPPGKRWFRLAEGAAGVTSQFYRFLVSARVNGVWLEPSAMSGYTELGGDLNVQFNYQPIVVRLRAGLGRRNPGDPTRVSSNHPRGMVQLRTRLAENLYVLLESHWRRATDTENYLPGNELDRWVSGIQLEVVQ